MNAKLFPAILLALCFSILSAYPAGGRTFDIVPKPASITEEWNRAFIFPDKPGVYASDARLRGIASTFVNGISGNGFPDFRVVSSKRKAVVKLYIDPSLSEEEYTIDGSAKDFVVIKGGSSKGVWWGLQTLEQILNQARTRAGQILLPTLAIRDKPRFSYRGAHLDCCRHFFTVEEVKSYIDMISLHKINTFHWHLTDDQGWRIEILKYPLLTEVGSVRSETLGGHLDLSDEYDGVPHSGYYTQDQIRDIVAYAAARQVTIVPEIEMPGHALAALASYPWLGCVEKDYHVWSRWGISKEVFCVGKPSTMEFLENVLNEVCNLFPGEYIHIGGDEAPRDRWKECPHCQAKMRELGLGKEAQLQSYLVNHIEKYLNSKGRKIIGWDEILEGGVSKTATVMSWRGMEGGIEASRLGNDVIMTPHTYLYLDYYQSDDPKGNGEPLAIGGRVTLERCYSFDPFEGLDEEATHHVKGLQANLWTEYISDYDHVRYMALPRLAAAAEVAWSQNKSGYHEFVERLSNGLVPVYKARGYNYAGYAFRNTGE